MSQYLIKEDHLPIREGHQVYYAEYGRPDGETVLCLHGGPGSCSKARHAEIFDLTRYRVILFDQRGCGRSLPYGELNNNNADLLLQDIEHLRKRLKITKWYLSGGSWGAALALAYAQAHPRSVKGLLLASTFLVLQRDLHWALQGGEGAARMFPEVRERWLDFLAQYQISGDGRIAAKILEKMEISESETVRKMTAEVLNREFNLFSTLKDVQFMGPEDISEEEINAARIFLHFEAHDFFLQPDQLLEKAGRIRSVPVVAIHGRYDVLCPLESIWSFKRKMKNMELIVLPSDGHKITADGEVLKREVFNRFLRERSESSN